MAATGMAVVQLGPKRLELQEVPLPEIGSDDGLLRVERCGVCGTDVEQFDGELSWIPFPVIPGHEPVGVIDRIGEQAARRWGVQPGDRVIVEAPIPCRACEECAVGHYNNCRHQLTLGFTPLTTEPRLFGGYSQYLYLHPNATLHRMSSDVPVDVAPFYNALGCGVHWAAEVGQVQLGETVVILGAGQRGIACAMVAKAVGARTVIMTGLASDARRLEVAKHFGVDFTIDVELEDVVERVGAITGGRLADLVIDVVPRAASTVVDAIKVAKPLGRIVLAGMKGDTPVPGLLSDTIAMKSLTIRGVRGKRSTSFPLAIQMLESRRFPFELLEPKTYSIAEAELAIDDLAGRMPSGQSICVSLSPDGL